MSKKVVLIIVIVIAVLIAAFGVIYLTSPDEEITTDDYSASFKGYGKDNLTITLKGQIPEGYYWHIVADREGVVTYDVVKQTNKVVKVKFSKVSQGKTPFAIYASNSEDSKRTSKKEVAKGEDEEDIEVEIDNSYVEAVSLECEVHVGIDDKFYLYGFKLNQNALPVLLLEDMPYPIYSLFTDNSIVFTIPDADRGWVAEDYDETLLECIGPYYNSEGTAEFEVTFHAKGESEFKLSNYMLNSGVIMTIGFIDDVVESIDKVSSKVITTQIEKMVINDIRINPDDLINDTMREQYEKIKTTSGEVIVPALGGIDQIVNIAVDGEIYEISDEISAMEFIREKVVYSYDLTEKLSLDELLEGREAFMAEQGALFIEEDVNNETFGKIHVSGYAIPADKSATALDSKTKGTYLSYWSIGKVSAILYAEDITWQDVKDFVADLVNKKDLATDTDANTPITGTNATKQTTNSNV